MKKYIIGIVSIMLSLSQVGAQSYILTDVAGLRVFGFSGDGGAATNAHMYNPMGVYVDNSGNIYFTDWGNSRVRWVNGNGIINTMSGNGVYGYSGDGGQATDAELNGPMEVFKDASGNIYITDIGNARIRKVNTSGSISTFAGSGKYGYSGDGGPATAADFADPIGICSDAVGNIYLTDVFNNRVRKINTAGIISTVAGNGVRGYSGDGGTASLAEMYYPTGVAVDNTGNIYIADADNSCIRKVNTYGIISTIAGNGAVGYSGDGVAATATRLFYPAGVAVDKWGNVYITDSFNSRIRKVDSAGIITTIAGNGIPGYSGVGGFATLAEILNPVDIVTDTSGNLYFTNAFNNHIQKLSPAPAEAAPNAYVKVYPNPSDAVFTFMVENYTGYLRAEIYNVLGQKVSYIGLNQESTRINLAGNSRGVYFYRVLTADNRTFAAGKIVLL